MILTGYGICVVISVVLTLIMALRNYDHIDIYDWSVSLLLPFLIIVYWIKANVSTPETALMLICTVGLLNALLLVSILFSLLHGLGIRIRLWAKVVMYSLMAVLLIPTWQLLRGGGAAALVAVENTGEGYSSRLTGAYDALQQYPFLLALIVLITCVVLLVLSRKRDYSRRTVVGYLIFIVLWIALYLVENIVETDFTGLPFLYVAIQFLVVVGYDQIHSHDISSLITENQKSHTARGYVAIGLSGRFLSANEKAYDFFPDLRGMQADSRFPADSEAGRQFAQIIENFETNRVGTGTFPSGNRTLASRISNFSLRKGGPVRGYLIDVRDATEEIRNMELLTDYNTRLNREVDEKTRNIEAIQEKLVLSMADMVENRDGNTGGHVRRTSDVVSILIREILKQNLFPLDETTARDIVRTAPMHDLGKVSIDSSILNKPGRLTPEEYTIMKTHSTLSGQMVKILLEGVEEESLVRTAYHIARHHHERWDGRGYPDGLVGETIPVEARIMAVADVYDALVSKRVYKEPMSFEQAAKIMCEGMGTQFDPNMRAVFLYCRPELEAYYSGL